MTDPLPEPISDESPATKLVYRSLPADGEPLTYEELKERTELGRRTLERTTSRLQDADVIERCWASTQCVAWRRTARQSDGQNTD